MLENRNRNINQNRFYEVRKTVTKKVGKPFTLHHTSSKHDNRKKV